MINYPRKPGLRTLNKIKKLADKKGTPMTKVTFGKKSIHFEYRVGETGVIGFSYPSILKGIQGELRRLGGYGK